MASYQYKARDKIGKMVTGTMAADSKDAVALKLEKMGLVPIDVMEKKKDALQLSSLGNLKKISFEDLNMFTRQLFTLQRAGLPLLSSLTALKDQASNVSFKRIIKQIGREVEGGSPLSSSLEKFPRVFNALYVNMIRTGEVSGKMPEVLNHLTSLGEHEEEIRMRVQTAIRYPLIVTTSILLAFLVLITAVIPRFERLYSRFSTELPLPTKILLMVNYIISHYWWLVILVGIAAVFLFRRYVSTKKGILWWDNLRLKVPVFGPLMVKLTMSRFSRITGTMMKSGVPILTILELVKDSVGNAVIARVIDRIRLSVNEGKGMLEPMKESDFFPPVVTQMVAVGEKTGKLDELLIHVSDYYDSQIDYTIKNLVSLIEPILIVFLGCMVLMMALGIFLPMWSLLDLFR